VKTFPHTAPRRWQPLPTANQPPRPDRKQPVNTPTTVSRIQTKNPNDQTNDRQGTQFSPDKFKIPFETPDQETTNINNQV